MTEKIDKDDLLQQIANKAIEFWEAGDWWLDTADENVERSYVELRELVDEYRKLFPIE